MLIPRFHIKDTLRYCTFFSGIVVGIKIVFQLRLYNRILPRASRVVILNQGAVAPGGTLKVFQGCHGVSHNVSTVWCTNMVHKINKEFSHTKSTTGPNNFNTVDA